MGKMLDNFRAWWNGVADSIGDPGKLAQLSVVDLEKAIKKAKEAAAPVIGAPVAIKERLDRDEKVDRELTTKIKALVASGNSGEGAAHKYVERQVQVRKNIASLREEYADASAASTEWLGKIRILETELYNRRQQADKLQASYEVAKAEQKLGKVMANVDAIAGTDTFSDIERRVDKEKAKAAGLSAMSGLSDKMADEKVVRDAEVENLMQQYLNEK